MLRTTQASAETDVPEVFVLHENASWLAPLRAAFSAEGLAYEEWDLSAGNLDLQALPPEGVFYNRMSASSYTRGHRFAPEYAVVVLNWLENHGRRVVNGSRALALEINKAAQYAALQAAGVRTPWTVAVHGRDGIAAAARESFGDGPVILKPNRGGKGDGVRLFETVDELAAHVTSDGFVGAVDDIHLLQQYVYASERFITRAEFVGGRFSYAVRVDTSDGFELCPADACQIPGASDVEQPKFRIWPDGEGITTEQIRRYEQVLAANDIEVAGIEFVTDAEGRAFTYDINTNTNYNPAAEAAAGHNAMRELARFLGRERQTIGAAPPVRAVG